MATVPGEEFTVDELAQRANMTVRNVRAYTTRGLIDPPRLVGRTGYYSTSHLNRLNLIRSLLDRGFTLAAVENALAGTPGAAPDLALDLISLFEVADLETEPQRLSRAEFDEMTGKKVSDRDLQRLTDLELIEVDGDALLILLPEVVRPGISALALGLSAETVISIATVQRQHLRNIAADTVRRVTEELVQPVLDAGLPEAETFEILQKVEAMIPIASQSVLGQYKTELRKAIETEIVDKLQDLTEN